MTPPASAAARAAAQPAPRQRRARPAPARAAGGRPPRRYSGPAGGIARAAAVPAAPGIALPRRKPPAPRARRARSLALPSLPLAAVVSPRRLLELSLRGRVWIGIVAFALIGIVTAQLIILRLNTSIGDSLNRAAQLQRENAAMAITNSEAGSGEAIEAGARRFGMVALLPGELEFLRAAAPVSAQGAVKALNSGRVSTQGGLTSAGAGSTSSSTSFVTPASGETAVSGLPQESQQAAPTSGEPAASGQTAGPASQAGATPTQQAQPQQSTVPAQEAQVGVQAGATEAPAGAGG